MLRKISLVLLFSLVCCLTASAQTVDELVAKHIQARGGLEKLKAVKSMKMTAKLIQAGQQIPVVMQRKRPESMRMELTIQGKTLVQAYDGSTAWVLAPFSGSNDAEKMNEDQTKQMQSQADFDGSLVDYKAKGNTVELAGKEDVEGSPAYKLKVTRKNGDISYVFLDAENYLEVKSTEKIKAQGNEIEVETFSSDYKPVNGMLMSHVQEGKIKGQTAFQISIDKIEIDAPVDDNLFHMPAKAAASPTK